MPAEVEHINGGICSIKIPQSNSLQLWTELSMFIIGENLFDNNKEKMNKINGISICPKNICSIVKIWNSNSSDITTYLTKSFTNKYNKYSIKFKKNKAEY